MSIIAKLSIMKRIMLLCLLPLLSLIAVSGHELWTSYEHHGKTVSALKVIKATPDISDLVHELQKERGRSAGFLSSRGAKFSDKIIPARSSTNDILNKFKSIPFEEIGLTAYETFNKPYKLALVEISELDEYRKKVDNHTLNVKQMATFYTGLINHLLEMIESVESSSDNAELIRTMIAYNAILKGKEYAGLERAMGAAGFGSGDFNQVVYANLVRFVGNQKAKFVDFEHHATKKELERYTEIQKHPSFNKLKSMRKIAFAAPFGGDASGITAGEWFQTSTERINELKKLEDTIAKDIYTYATKLNSDAATRMTILAVILATLIIGTAILSYWVSSSIVSQIKKLTDIMKLLSRGDTSTDILYMERSDEVGLMARTIDIFKKNSLERKKMRNEAIAEREKEAQKQSYITGVVNDFKRLDEEIRASLEEQTDSMKASAKSLHSSTQHVADRAGKMKDSSLQASGNVEVVAGSTRELSESMQEIASQIHKAERVVREASETAQETDREVTSLSQSAEKISDVIELVRNIAEQTNLLALNATIEAARAGQAGKGFAVVAQEVKQLSEQTAKAIDEIVSQISAVQSSSHSAVKAIRNISEQVKEISSVTVNITAAIEEQQTATSKIAESVEAASAETNNVAEDVEDVNSSLEHTFSEANKVQTASKSLSDVSSQLAASVSNFLTEVNEDVINRRNHLRKQVNRVGVITYGSSSYDFMIENASEDGMFVSGKADLEVGGEIELELSDGRYLKATVVRTTDEGFGVKFDEPIPGIRWLTEGLEGSAGEDVKEAS